MNDKEIEINGVRVHFTDSGETDLRPIILMHGWGCETSTLASVASIFKGRMRVINIDLPGHGKSSEPPFVWGVQDFRDMVAALIEKLGLDRPALLGHSFGGRVSILLASSVGRNPDGTEQTKTLPEISKVVLVDSAGVKPRRSAKYYVKVYWFKTMKRLLPLLLGRKKGAEMIERLRGRAGSDDYRRSSSVMRAVMSRCVNEDLCFAMPEIKAPVLLVWGENDTATPLSDAIKMEKLIPDAGLVSFPGCGHYSFLDNPAGFRAVIQEFFKNDFKK